MFYGLMSNKMKIHLSTRMDTQPLHHVGTVKGLSQGFRYTDNS